MRGDLADPAADRERHLDHLVEVWLVSLGTESADVIIVLNGFQRRAGIEDTAAAGTQYVPRQFEDPQPRRMQKGGDDPLLAEPPRLREIDHIDAAQVAIAGLGDKPLDFDNGLRIRRLPQYRKQPLGFARQTLGHFIKRLVQRQDGAQMPVAIVGTIMSGASGLSATGKTELSGFRGHSGRARR
jgi:hypothetical protein